MNDAVRIRDQTMRQTQTLGNLDSFDRFVVHGTGALFDELVTFDTEIQ
jgi:hypothetical protein